MIYNSDPNIVSLEKYVFLKSYSIYIISWVFCGHYNYTKIEYLFEEKKLFKKVRFLFLSFFFLIFLSKKKEGWIKFCIEVYLTMKNSVTGTLFPFTFVINICIKIYHFFNFICVSMIGSFPQLLLKKKIN